MKSCHLKNETDEHHETCASCLNTCFKYRAEGAYKDTVEFAAKIGWLEMTYSFMCDVFNFMTVM